MTSSGQLPIDRSGGKASEASLNAGLAVLAEGEGSRNFTPGRGPGPRMDAFIVDEREWLGWSLKREFRSFPTVMIDTDKVMPLGSSLPKVHRVGVV